MSDKAYLNRFEAASLETQGEHIALLNAKGKLTAPFLTEVVESWSE